MPATKHRKRKFRVRNVVIPMTGEQKRRLEAFKPQWQSFQGFVISTVSDAVRRKVVPPEVERLKLSAKGVRATSVFVELPESIFDGVREIIGKRRPVDVAAYILGLFQPVLNPFAAATISPQMA